jgi:hypothetical protein
MNKEAQLDRMLAVTSNLVKMNVRKTTNKTRTNPVRNQEAYTRMTNVPYNQATTVYNGACPPTRFAASETIGFLELSSTTPVGTLLTFPINPTQLSGTRLSSMSLNFQRFRVRRLGVTLICNLPFTAGGSVYMGYCSNPDQMFSTTSTTLLQQIKVLPYSCAANLTVPVSMNCKVDTTKQFFIDIDSSEIMNTTNGKVLIALQSSSNITGTALIPIDISYDVEFIDPAVQDVASPTTQVFPGGTWGSGTTPGFSTGDIVPLPSLTVGIPYLIEPAYQLSCYEGAEEINVEAQIMTILSGGVSWSFWRTMNDYNESLAPLALIAGNTTPRTTVNYFKVN